MGSTPPIHSKKIHEGAAYPHWSEDAVWEMCLHLLSKDSPLPGKEQELQAFRDVFREVYRRLQDEHNHVKYKYFRGPDGRGIINPLYFDHYAILLYRFSRALHLKGVDALLLDLLFFSIKSRCGMDLFYQVEIGDYFLPLHAHGAVLGRARYGKYLVVMQYCTVGNNKETYPSFGDGVILRPGAMVLGNCHVGANVQVAAGALVIDKDIPANSIVFGRVPDLVIRENPQDNIAQYFDVIR